MIDTHSHIFSEEFLEEIPLVIERAISVGMQNVIMPNIDADSLQSLLSVCQQYPDFCKPALGLHPTSVDANYKAQLETILQTLNETPNCVAIGEIGLDLYWDKTFIAEQQDAFAIQLQWALDRNLPVIIHQRDAFDEIIAVLDNFGKTLPRGIFHSFGGTMKQAEIILSKGFLLGIGGIVTFKKSTLPDVLKDIPLQKIVVETDAPYLSPVPFRGKRNEPAYIVHTINKLSQIYEITAEEVGEITTRNTMDIFNLR
jgi:TatD DNase family protein